MIDEKKIRLMTRLAIYDQYEGKKDRQIHNYYQSDYVYMNNWWTRLTVTIGCLIIIGWYLFDLVFIKGVSIVELDYKSFAIKIGIFIVFNLALYTLISTYIYTRKYYQSQRRMKQYFQLIEELEKYQSIEKAEKELEESHGTDISIKRINNRLL
ncbi:MAG: hypothetical protein GX962_15050 [Epulopiscium sp.]|nr:hypothetical protein [Candidatus Epulonipiscium sp.]